MVREAGAWLANLRRHAVDVAAPALGFAGCGAGGARRLAARPGVAAFLAAALAVFGIIATVGLAMFPFILPSFVRPDEQPDGLGRLVEPADALDHAGRA